jgi:hypothetical protein
MGELTNNNQRRLTVKRVVRRWRVSEFNRLENIRDKAVQLSPSNPTWRAKAKSCCSVLEHIGANNASPNQTRLAHAKSGNTASAVFDSRTRAVLARMSTHHFKRYLRILAKENRDELRLRRGGSTGTVRDKDAAFAKLREICRDAGQ